MTTTRVLRALAMELAPLLAAPCAWAESAKARPVIAVDSVQVKLFYAHSGRLSPPVREKDPLVNVMIGEYTLRNDRNTEPADSVIVDVTVSAPAGAEPFGSVELVVTDIEDGKVLLRQTRDTSTFSKEGKSHVAFLYPHTGCARLRFEATAQTASAEGRSKPKQVSVPFACHTD